MIGAVGAAALPIPIEAAWPNPHADIPLTIADYVEFHPNDTMTITATLGHGASLWIDGEQITNYGEQPMIVSRTIKAPVMTMPPCKIRLNNRELT